MTADQTIRDPFAIKGLSPDEVIEEYRGLVGSVVNNLAKKLRLKVEFDDLEAYGFQGLLEAHERFEPDSRANFGSFAYYRIRGAILDGCRKQGWMTRDRTKKGRHISAINEYRASTASARAVSPRPRSFSEAVGRVTDEVTSSATIFLIQEHDLNTLGATSKANQHARLEKIAVTQLLRQAFQLLDDDEREVVVRFHFESEKMAEIGETMGHSASWVSRINARAIEKMRDYVLEHE